MASLKEIEEKMLLNCGLYPQMNEVEVNKTTRRKKVKAEDGSVERKKRKLNEEQVAFLEMNFGRERKLESGRKMCLAMELGLNPKQVAVWFQNRRTRWKNRQLEDEYMKLKSQHEAVIVEKCHNEKEVLTLKKRLAEAEEKIMFLSAGGCSEEGSSLNTSLTENYDKYNLGDQFGAANDLLYMNDDYNYITDNDFIFGM